MSINDPDNFSGRVNLAALYISQGRRSSRGFDNCFENNDGDAVATALYRRAQKAPDGDLARNLWRYLSKDTVEPVALANAHRTNLSQWARELREEAAKAWAPASDLNDCQRAIGILGARPDAEYANAGSVFIRCKVYEPGELTDGTRLYLVDPCERKRWLVVLSGFDIIAEIDQRQFFERPEDMAAAVMAAIEADVEKRRAPFRSELTPAGEQLVIPGCERNLAPAAKQLSLFG